MQAKTAHFSLYLTELNLELAVTRTGGSERGAAAAAAAGGRALPELPSQEAERSIFGDLQRPLASACKPASRPLTTREIRRWPCQG